MHPALARPALARPAIILLSAALLLAACEGKRTRKVVMGDGSTIEVEETVENGVFGATTTDEKGEKNSFSFDFFNKRWPDSPPDFAPEYPGARVVDVGSANAGGMNSTTVHFMTPDKPSTVTDFYKRRSYGVGLGDPVKDHDSDTISSFTAGRQGEKALSVEASAREAGTEVRIVYGVAAKAS